MRVNPRDSASGAELRRQIQDFERSPEAKAAERLLRDALRARFGFGRVGRTDAGIPLASTATGEILELSLHGVGTPPSSSYADGGSFYEPSPELLTELAERGVTGETIRAALKAFLDQPEPIAYGPGLMRPGRAAEESYSRDVEDGLKWGGAYSLIDVRAAAQRRAGITDAAPPLGSKLRQEIEVFERSPECRAAKDLITKAVKDRRGRFSSKNAGIPLIRDADGATLVALNRCGIGQPLHWNTFNGLEMDEGAGFYNLPTHLLAKLEKDGVTGETLRAALEAYLETPRPLAYSADTIDYSKPQRHPDNRAMYDRLTEIRIDQGDVFLLRDTAGEAK